MKRPPKRWRVKPEDAVKPDPSGRTGPFVPWRFKRPASGKARRKWARILNDINPDAGALSFKIPIEAFFPGGKDPHLRIKFGASNITLELIGAMAEFAGMTWGQVIHLAVQQLFEEWNYRLEPSGKLLQLDYKPTPEDFERLGDWERVVMERRRPGRKPKAKE